MSRPVWIITGLSASALAAFIAGRASAPQPDVREREVERVVYRDRVVTVTQREAAQVRNVVVYRDRVVTPDGTVREREVERVVSSTVDREQTVQAVTRDVARDVDRRVSATMPAPLWRAGVLVGVPLKLPPGPVLVGGQVERRLLGPVSLGAWVLLPTGPGAGAAVGVSLKAEW